MIKQFNIEKAKYAQYASLVMGPLRAIRSLGNSLGLAWWAKVETKDPNVIYWFGPFMTRRSLNGQLSRFLEDLSNEGPAEIDYCLVRERREEPLTV